MANSAYETRHVLLTLRDTGYRATGRQNGSHAEYVDDHGRRVTPKITERDYPLRSLQSLRREIDLQGGDGARFWKWVRGR